MRHPALRSFAFCGGNMKAHPANGGGAALAKSTGICLKIESKARSFGVYSYGEPTRSLPRSLTPRRRRAALDRSLIGAVETVTTPSSAVRLMT